MKFLQAEMLNVANEQNWHSFYSVQLRANECCPIYQFQAIRQNEECGESETSCMNLYDYEAHKK